MQEREDHDLEEPSSWDYERAEKRPSAKPDRAVVSVAFSRKDFERVAGYAERSGMRTSEFIRRAALDQARAGAKITEFSFLGGTSGTLFVEKPFEPSTLVFARVSLEEDELVTT